MKKSESKWDATERILNLIYSLYTNGTKTSYDWNKDACKESGGAIAGGAIAGIVIGAVVLIAIIVVGIICWRRKQQQKTEDPNMGKD